jgi:hypothetical protein
MGDDERAKLNKLVDKHFDAAPQGAKAPKAAKATKKEPKVAVKAAKATKQAAEVKVAPEGKKRGRKPKAASVGVTSTVASAHEAMTRVQTAQIQVGTITDAIKAIKMCKEMNSSLDVEKIAQGTKDGSDALVQILNEIRVSLVADPPAPTNGASAVTLRTQASQFAATTTPIAEDSYSAS